MFRGLDAVLPVAADDSCHPHHESREAWKNKRDMEEARKPSGE